MPADISLLWLADQTAPAVEASVASLLRAALVAEEALSTTVDVRVRRCTPDPGVGDLLDQLPRGSVLHRTAHTGVAEGWADASRTTDAGLLLLGTSAAHLDPLALAHLAAALADHPDADVAAAGSRAPAVALVRRRLLEACGGLQVFSCAASRSGAEVLSLLVRAAELRDPRSVLVVPQAVAGGVPVVQPPRAVVPGWDPGEVWTARPGSVLVGAHTYFTPRTRFWTLHPSQEIHVGRYCSVADDVRFLNPHPRDGELLDERGTAHRVPLHGLHRPSAVSTFPMGKWPGVEFEDAPEGWRGQVQTIGNDVWVGHGATVLGPVTVGDGAVVGAGAVVAKDVEPYAVVAGNPARVVRRRFSDEVVDQLLAVRWWDWTEDLVVARAHLLASDPADLLGSLEAGEVP